MGHIRQFDGLRGLLALWVFFAHAIELGPFSRVAGHLRPEYAVDVFIILSGFVIFHLLSRGEDYATFISRRFFRLFPVFAICFLFSLLLCGGLRIKDEVAFGFIGERPLMPYLATHALMLHGAVPEQFLPNSSEAILPPAWSISLEWQFYLVAPMLFWFAMRPNWKTAGLLTGLVVLRVLSIRHSLGLLVPGAPRDLTFEMNAFLPLKLEFFAAGALSWMLWRAFEQGRLELTPRRLALCLAGAAMILVGMESLPLALWMAGFSMLVDAQFGRAWRGSTLLARTLERRVVRFLGEISYSFYLVHMPALAVVRHALAKWMPSAPSAIFAMALIVLAGIAALLLATALHFTVEKPMIALGKRLTSRWAAPPHAVPVASAPQVLTRNSSQ